MSEIVLSSVTTTRCSEIDWLYRGVARFFPEEWERFRAGVPEADRTAWELARAWPDAELVAIRDAGHQGSDTTREHMLGALDKFARR